MHGTSSSSGSGRSNKHWPRATLIHKTLPEAKTERRKPHQITGIGRRLCVRVPPPNHQHHKEKSLWQRLISRTAATTTTFTTSINKKQNKRKHFLSNLAPPPPPPQTSSPIFNQYHCHFIPKQKKEIFSSSIPN